MAKLRFNKNYDINRVVKALVNTILALYVGGTIISTFGTVMTCTNSPLYSGVSLIGWTLSDNFIVNTTSAVCNTTNALNGVSTGTYNNLVTSTSGAGVLAVVGIIGIAGVVMQFISYR